MRGQKRVEDARRRAGVPRIHVFGRKWRRGWPGQAPGQAGPDEGQTSDSQNYCVEKYPGS